MALEALAVICKYGIIASTLFTFHGRTCHNDKLTMQCPNDTKISVRWAQYGRLRSSDYQCQYITAQEQQFHLRHHHKTKQKPKQHGSSSSSSSRKLQDLRSSRTYSSSGDCLASSSLKVVADLCNDRQRCRVHASQKVFPDSHCPLSQLEVGYQCIPGYSSKTVTCMGTELSLYCPSRLKILISAAFYGYQSPGENKCFSQIGFDQECIATCASYVVASRCHGQKTCRVFVDGSTFGDPCRPGTYPYLVVYHACVPARILKKAIKKDDFPFSKCTHTPAGNATDNKGFDYFEPDFFTTDPTTTIQDSILGTRGRLLSHWVTVGLFIKRNLEKFLLCFVLGGFVGLVLLLLVIVGKLMLKVGRLKFMRAEESMSFDSRPPPISPGTRLLVCGQRKDTVFRSSDIEEAEDELDTEVARRTAGPATISVEEIPHGFSSPDNDSPIFVHVESPRESPVLGRFNSNGESNGEEKMVMAETCFRPRPMSYPNQATESMASGIDHSLLLGPAKSQPAGLRSSSGGEARASGSERERDYELLPCQPPPLPYRSTSALPRLQASPARLSTPAASHSQPPRRNSQPSSDVLATFSNPYRQDESLAKRVSSLHRKLALT